MLRKNVETFLECDKDYEEAEVILFGARLILPPPFVREPGLAAAPSVMSLLDWKATALTRTGI